MVWRECDDADVAMEAVFERYGDDLADEMVGAWSAEFLPLKQKKEVV